MALTRLGTNAITTVPNSAITLDAAEIPNLDAAKITTGTLADARISSSSVVQHSAPTDLQPIKSDISALALREATNESSAAFNLPNQFIDTFATDTLGTKTNVSVSSGHVASVIVVSPSISGAGNSANASPSFSLNTTTGLITLNNSSVGYQSGSPDSNGVYWSIIDFGQDITFNSGLMVELLTGVINDGNANAGLCQFNIKNNADAWVFGSGGITPTVSETFVAGGGNIGGANDIYNQDLDYQGIYTSVSGLPRRATLTWSGTATGRKLYTAWSNTWGEPTTYKLYDNSNGTSGNGTNLGVSGNKNVASTTGTAIQGANTVGSAKTKVGGTMLYKDNAGTATLGTDLIIYFTCDGGSNWTEADSYNAITPVYSTGVKQVRLGETTCTSGTDVRYKAVWANQASGSKETQLHGIGVNY